MISILCSAKRLKPRASCPVKRLSGTRLFTRVYLLSWLITVDPIARFILSRSEPTAERIRRVRHLLDCEPPRRVVLRLWEIRFSFLQSAAFWVGLLNFFAVLCHSRHLLHPWPCFCLRPRRLSSHGQHLQLKRSLKLNPMPGSHDQP